MYFENVPMLAHMKKKKRYPARIKVIEDWAFFFYLFHDFAFYQYHHHHHHHYRDHESASLAMPRLTLLVWIVSLISPSTNYRATALRKTKSSSTNGLTSCIQYSNCKRAQNIIILVEVVKLISLFYWNREDFIQMRAVNVVTKETRDCFIIFCY